MEYSNGADRAMLNEDQAPLLERNAPRWVGPLTIAVGVLMGVAVIAHVPGLDGPYYWKWKYTRLWPVPVYGGFALAALPLLTTMMLHELGKAREGAVVTGAVITALSLRLVWMMVHSPALDLSYLAYAVRHPWITSYYTDATGLANFSGWLSHFDEVLNQLSVHSRNKPPGPILLCYAFIKIYGDSYRTQIAVGLTLAALQSLSVFGCWFALRVLSRSTRAAIYGAAFLAMCPGYVLCFPMFDSMYILPVSVLVGLWAIAVESDRLALGAAAGLALAITSFMTFNFLVIGFFMLGYALLCSERKLGSAIVVILRQATAVLVAFVLANLLLYVISGYNPIKTFIACLENQRYIMTLPTVTRPYPRTVLFDLTDIALGSAWISVVLAGAWTLDALRTKPRARMTRIVLLGLAQLVVVAVTALLPGETARVWNFLYPLVMLPVGLQITRFSSRWAVAVYATELFVLAALAQNMTFL